MIEVLDGDLKLHSSILNSDLRAKYAKDFTPITYGNSEVERKKFEEERKKFQE